MSETTGDPAALDVKSVVALATTVVGSFTALAGTATIGGGVDRVARDSPALAAGAVMAIGLGTVIAGFHIFSVRAPGASQAPSLSLAASFVLFVAGLGLALAAV